MTRLVFLLSFCCFFSSCQKKKQVQAHEEDAHIHAYADDSVLTQMEGIENELFYELWESDSLLVFEKISDFEKQLTYTKTRKEVEDYVTRHYTITLDARNKIVKLSEIDEINDKSLRTITVAYFKQGELIFIEFLNDMVEEPVMSYFVKSKVINNQFDPDCFIAKTRIHFGDQAELSVDKISTECIFNALVVYDRMRDIYEK